MPLSPDTDGAEAVDARWAPPQSDAAVVVFASDEVAGDVHTGFFVSFSRGRTTRFDIKFYAIVFKYTSKNTSCSLAPLTPVSALFVRRGLPYVFCCPAPSPPPTLD